jgi:hypothetical protein
MVPWTGYGEEASKAPDAVKKPGQPIKKTQRTGTKARRSVAAPTATMRAERVGSREPSGIYGWFVVTDPATGDRWYPTDEEGRPRGRISMTLQFRKVADGRTRDMHVNSGNRNWFHPDASRNAWRYAIPFDHDTTWEAEPDKDVHQIKYSPNVWRFVGIVGTARYRIFTRVEGANRVDWDATFERRTTPFADLPDVRP